ncbi:MAG: acetyltransferase [Saprospiraceae bacterium]|jgi:acetyltransferase
MNPLNRIFDPKTVAIIGASNNEGSVGYALIKNMIGSGFKGTVYPINFKHKSIYGVRSYAKLRDTRDEIDLAVIATPAATVPDIVKECGEYGVGGIVIISAGFMEAGEEGQQLSETILAYARQYNMRIIGPNCLGFIKPSIKLNASFANKMALPGKIAFISQSGALCTAILDWSVEKNVGFSYFVSIGSMIDVGFHDLIDYFGNDPNTSSIVIYMESLTYTRKFMSAARAFARTKPIIVLKAGKSDAGAKVALSHTGTLAGNEMAFEAAFKRAGIISVNTIDELFNSAQALAMQPRPKGNKLAIVTNAGGPGVLATDHLIKLGGQLAELGEETYEKLNKALPAVWSHGNPVDVLGDASAERYMDATEAVLKDDNVDGVLVILTPQAMTKADEIAKEMVKLGKKYSKTILASWMGQKDVDEGCDILDEGGIPVYRIPENAVNTFMSMYKYTRNIQVLYETPSSIPEIYHPDTEKNHELIKSIMAEKRYVLTEEEAKKILINYQIPIAKHKLAASEKEVQEICAEIGFPVVMKIASPDITHKTDTGGVILNIRNETTALEAFHTILDAAKAAKPNANIKGILIEEMVSKKYELIIGAKKDPIFGPVIIFGMGGVAVEVFKDLNVGLPPLNMALAQRIIEDTKIYKLLKGYRGMKPADIESIKYILYKFAYLVMDFPQIKEIDINPYVVDHTGGVVLDAKIILDEEVDPNIIKTYSHLVVSPYPRELMTEWILSDGTETLIRPIKPEDEDMERELFKRISKQTEYFRFFGYIGKMTHEKLTRFTQIDYDREMALVARVKEGDTHAIAGVVRLVADADNETAEFAILVGDQWQGKGLGNKFMDLIMEIAENRNIKKVYATVLNANATMLHMFRKRGFTIRQEDDDSSYAEKLLTIEKEVTPV